MQSGQAEPATGGTNDLRVLVACVVLCEAAGVVPGFLTADIVAAWYPTLQQPWFTPPAWVFGPVWTVLYLLMGIALYLVWRDGRQHVKGRRALWLFAVQLGLNATWTLVFFGLQSVVGGVLVILALWIAIVATVVGFGAINRRAAVLLAPYLLWVTFAAALNVEIWRLNG